MLLLQLYTAGAIKENRTDKFNTFVNNKCKQMVVYICIIKFIHGL